MDPKQYAEAKIVDAYGAFELIDSLVNDVCLTDDAILYGFSGLRSLSLPDGIVAFDRKLGLEYAAQIDHLELPSTIRWLGEFAIKGYNGRELELPVTLERLDAQALAGSAVEVVTFTGNAPKPVSTDVFVEKSGWMPELDAAHNLKVRVFPGTTGWNDEDSAGLPSGGLWPTAAAKYKRRAIEYVQQALYSDKSGTDEFRYYDKEQDAVVSVPQTWLDQYGLLAADVGGNAILSDSVSTLTHSVFDSYVAGLNPTNGIEKFEAKIEIENGEVKVSWTPDLNSGLATGPRVYRVLGRQTLDATEPWQDIEAMSHEVRAACKFFKVTVSMPHN